MVASISVHLSRNTTTTQHNGLLPFLEITVDGREDLSQDRFTVFPSPYTL